MRKKKWEDLGGCAAWWGSINVMGRDSLISGKWLFKKFKIVIRIDDTSVDVDEIIEEIDKFLRHAFVEKKKNK
ncbi:MAG: hypothetical protein Q6363_007890 [Candidatus Njordarchaeota archaeon]